MLSEYGQDNPKKHKYYVAAGGVVVDRRNEWRRKDNLCQAAV